MWMSNQAPHGVKGALEPLYAEQAKGGFQIIVPDVGGGFGGKIPPYPEDALLPWFQQKRESPSVGLKPGPRIF